MRIFYYFTSYLKNNYFRLGPQNGGLTERRVSVSSVESLDPEEWEMNDKTMWWRRPRGEWESLGRRGKVEIRVIRWFLRRTEVRLGWLWAKLAVRGKRVEHSFVSSNLECWPHDDASAPRNPGEGRTSLKGEREKRQTRMLPGGTLSRERWKNLRKTVYGLRNHGRTSGQTDGRTDGRADGRGTVERKCLNGKK